MSTPSLREPSFDRHPVEDIEPEQSLEDAYREASRRFLRVINHVMTAFRNDRCSQWWQFQFALGTRACMGKTMTHAATLCGVDRAAISKGAVEICNTLGLPPSAYMKDEDARESYQQTRKAQLS